ncbi:MAG TPA: phosphoribosylanthranilate isomerase [Acetobacteraceae bacterium]|jgi:phosphoribosylanthranilate isomerase
MTRVKICGVNDPVAFDTVVAEGADWLGFVFFPPSPRAITPAQAAALSARAEGGPARVGLFVDPSDGDVAAVLAVVKLDVLQVHAPPHRVAELRVCFGLPVWRAVGVATAADLPDVSGHADALLIEAKPPKNATRPGGNAVQFDWSLLVGWQAPCPWLLAGGLTADNVAEAIRVSGAPAVDVSSGVESAPGVKDPDRIRAFIRAGRAA